VRIEVPDLTILLDDLHECVPTRGHGIISRPLNAEGWVEVLTADGPHIYRPSELHQEETP